MFFKQKKPEVQEQMVHDAFYTAVCPICRITCIDSEHRVLSVVNEDASFNEKKLIECDKCHVAVYGRLDRIERTLQLYQKDVTKLFGYELISEKKIECLNLH